MLRMAAVGHPLTSGLRDCCNLLVESPDFQKARANRFAFFCKLAKTSALAYFCARLRVLRHKSATNANRQDVTRNFRQYQMVKKILIIGGLTLMLLASYILLRNDIAEYMLERHSIKWSENVKIHFSDYELTPKANDKFNVHTYYRIFLKANNVKEAYAFSYFD